MTHFHKVYDAVHNPCILLGPVPLANASFGRGSGPVHMTSVSCTGDEEMLSDCEHHSGIGAINCYHARDAGVVCTGKMSTPRKQFFQHNDNEYLTQVEHWNITPSKPLPLPQGDRFLLAVYSIFIVRFLQIHLLVAFTFGERLYLELTLLSSIAQILISP